LALGQRGDSLGSRQRIDEALHFFVFEGGAEVVEDDGIGGGKDEFIFLGVAAVEEEGVFNFSVIVRDVFFADGILERRRALLHFQTAVHLFCNL
jgi:hypothetical protein